LTTEIWIESRTVEQPILYGYKNGKSIIFENASINPYQRSVSISLTKEQYVVFYQQLLEMARQVWPDLVLKEATSFGNDYTEYYDKEFDNDGSASIDDDGIYFWPPAPHLESNRLYRFTKAKIQTYLFDLQKHAELKD